MKKEIDLVNKVKEILDDPVISWNPLILRESLSQLIDVYERDTVYKSTPPKDDQEGSDRSDKPER